MNGARDSIFCPAPWGLGEESKDQILLFSINKSISKIFITIFVCVLINERYKIYQTGFSFCHLGHALGVGLGVLRGINNIMSCCRSVMLSPWRETAISFGPASWGPGEGSKGQISFIFNYKVNFKGFYTKLCDCTHK